MENPWKNDLPVPKPEYLKSAFPFMRTPFKRHFVTCHSANPNPGLETTSANLTCIPGGAALIRPHQHIAWRGSELPVDCSSSALQPIQPNKAAPGVHLAVSIHIQTGTAALYTRVRSTAFIVGTSAGFS
jgi:hypothetical protein